MTFSSASRDLIPGVANGTSQVYVRDMVAGTTQLVSMGNNGLAGDGVSYQPSISNAGRFVAFTSLATNMTHDSAQHGCRQVYVRDTTAQLTYLVSRIVDSKPTACVKDRNAAGGSDAPVINSDGRYIAFESMSDDVTPGGPGSNSSHVYVRDRSTMTTRSVDITSAGTIFPAAYLPDISADGKRVSFGTVDFSSPGGDIYVRDWGTSTTTLASATHSGAMSVASFYARISANGRYVIFISNSETMVAHDGNNLGDAFRRDTLTGQTVMASVNTAGDPENDRANTAGFAIAGGISADGRSVLFTSEATNLGGGGGGNIKPDAYIRFIPS